MHKRVAFHIFGSFNKWEKQERPQSREHTSITWMDAKRSNRHKNETREKKLSTNNSSHHSVHPEYISSSYSHLKLKSYWSIRNSNGKIHSKSASQPEDKKVSVSHNLYFSQLYPSQQVCGIFFKSLALASGLTINILKSVPVLSGRKMSHFTQFTLRPTWLPCGLWQDW